MYKDINKPELIKGLKVWENPNNRFTVAMLHYSADPTKDPEREGAKWYENEKLGTPKATWLKEYEIDFSTKSGKLVFGSDFCDFDKNIHFINSFELPEPYDLILGLDFGQRNPTYALVAAITMNGTIYIIDEYYNPALPSVSSKEMFKKFDYLMGNQIEGKSIREKRIIANTAFSLKVIDPSTSAKNRSKIRHGEEIQYSVLEEFEDHGWDFELAQNDVLSGITRIREYLQLDSNKEAHLYFFKDKCPNLCHEFTNYKYREFSKHIKRERNQSEEPVKKDDHAVDALKYLMLTRPATPEKPRRELTRIEKDIQNLLKPKVLLDDWDIN
jgi:hypothetical protein